jgi:hypothetical protein
MDIEEPWMPIYPKPYMDIPLEILKYKYFNMLNEYYEKEKYVAVIDIKTFLKEGIFPLSTTIKFLLSVLPGTCKIIRMEKEENNSFFKFKLEDINKKIYMFYISKISSYKSKITMVYNTEKLEKNIESIDDFNNTFIKIIYGDKIINYELIKKAYDYCVEVKFRMAIFLFWISEPNNLKYSDEYHKLNNFTEKKVPKEDIKVIKEDIEEDIEDPMDFDNLLSILKNNDKIISKKELDEILNFNIAISNECLICLEKLSDQFNINMPCCKISYHFNCIKKWSNTSNNCPNCFKTYEKNEFQTYIENLRNQNKKKK